MLVKTLASFTPVFGAQRRFQAWGTGYREWPWVQKLSFLSGENHPHPLLPELALQRCCPCPGTYLGPVGCTIAATGAMVTVSRKPKEKLMSATQLSCMAR